MREHGKWHITQRAGGCGFGRALVERLHFRDPLASGLEVTFSRADDRVGIAQAEKPRNPQGHTEPQKLRRAQFAFLPLFQRGGKAIFLIRVGRVHQHHASDFARVQAGEEANGVSPHRVPYQHIGRRNTGCFQQRVQFFGHHPAGSWSRARLAVTDSGSVVGTSLREFSDLWLHLLPHDIGVTQAGVEDDGGTSLAGAIDVHPVAADINEPARHGIKSAVASLRDVLVEKSSGGEDHEQHEQAARDTAGPGGFWNERCRRFGHWRKVQSAQMILLQPRPMAFYMTGGTVMPMTLSARISSLLTTTTVMSKNCFRPSSGSLRIG